MWKAPVEGQKNSILSTNCSHSCLFPHYQVLITIAPTLTSSMDFNGQSLAVSSVMSDPLQLSAGKILREVQKGQKEPFSTTSCHAAFNTSHVPPCQSQLYQGKTNSSASS